MAETTERQFVDLVEHTVEPLGETCGYLQVALSIPDGVSAVNRVEFEEAIEELLAEARIEYMSMMERRGLFQ